MNYAEYPLKDIPEPHAHDVLCGRGGGTNNHIGNSHWRMLVAANKQLYITLPKRQKMLLSRSIVNAVRSQNPPGRFLQKDGKTKLWFDVGDQRAQEKTSQALREGAPDIRKKVAAAKASAGSGANSPVATPKTSGEVANSGAGIDASKDSQISAHPSTAPPVARQQRKPEPAVSAPEPLHYNPQEQQQQQQQQQQMNPMYYGHNAPGHMTLNERGAMIQNAMMNGARNLNGQHHNNYQPSYPYQQQQQQNHMQHQLQRQHEYQQQYQYQQQQHNNNVNYQQERQHYQQEQQYHNFDAPPPQELERDGLSFGSLHMTDAEMHKLQQGSSHNKNSRHKKSSNSNDANPPMGGVLEPTGISIGDVSMHSANTTNFLMKLEENGTSFGTMMSYNTLSSNNPDMVDGGLMDAVGTSFGSLSLDKNNRDMLFKTLEIAGGGSEVPPMFRSETKSSANLLDCSDTESESSRDKEKLTKQKSQAWEMMKTQLDKQTSKGASVGSHDLMPPPVGVPNHSKDSAAATFDNLEIALPPTTMEANFSTLSAWSAADDFKDNADGTNDNDDDSHEDAVAAPPPPPQLTKTDSF